MRSAGLSNWQIARPALALGLLVVAVMALLNFWLVPLSHTAFRQWQFEIRNQLVGVLVQEGVFSTLGNDLTVYARKRDPDGTLRGIMVHDQREASGAVTILAQAGRIGQGADGPRVTLYDGVRQQMEKGASGAPPRLTVLSFSENSVDLARVARNEETRSRDSRERSIAELLDPDPIEGLRPRELRRFRAEAHQRMASPITAFSFALVGLAVALTGQFRRHGGGIGVVLGIGIMVALLALGLTISNAATRRDGLIWLIWLHAILPGVISAWWLAGAPGLPRKAPPREALS
jgi:lipopolysaccharide export system permease protein